VRYADYTSECRILQTVSCFVISLFCSDLYRDTLFLHGQLVAILCYFCMNTGTSEVKQVHISSNYHRRLNYFSPCFSFMHNIKKLLEYSHISERSYVSSKNFLDFVSIYLTTKTGQRLV